MGWLQFENLTIQVWTTSLLHFHYVLYIHLKLPGCTSVKFEIPCFSQLWNVFFWFLSVVFVVNLPQRPSRSCVRPEPMKAAYSLCALCRVVLCLAEEEKTARSFAGALTWHLRESVRWTTAACVCRWRSSHSPGFMTDTIISPDSRKVWGGPHHCRCGWGGNTGRYDT